jgi:hypothetical protein
VSTLTKIVYDYPMKALVLLLIAAHEPAGYEMFMRIDDGMPVFLRSFDSLADCRAHASLTKKHAEQLRKLLDLNTLTIECERQQ